MPSADLKEFIVVANFVIALVVSGASVAGTWAVFRWRLARLEKTMFGNGTPGVIQEIEEIKIRCAGLHGKASEGVRV